MRRFARIRRFAGQHLPVATRADMRSIRRRARLLGEAYHDLATSVLGHDAGGNSRKAPSPEDVAKAEDQARVTRVQAELFDRLSKGESLESAAVLTVRDMIKAGRVTAAASFAGALAAREATARAGHLTSAVVASYRKLPELVLDELERIPAQLWRSDALVEYLDAAYRCDRARVVGAVTDLVSDQPTDLGPQAWFDVLKYAFAAGEQSLAQQAYQLLVDRAAQCPSEWKAAETEIEWLRPWLASEGQKRVLGEQPVGTPFALIDYGQPGRAKTSQNIGDHIQTIASLGHLVRHSNVRFHGPSDVAAFASELQCEVRPDRRVDTPAADVTLYLADRDASTHQTFPEGTWAFVFGWYMHPLFGLRHDFPLHQNLRPILISFHCNKRDMLTVDTLDYLRRYGPVGCRDWTTVDLLLSLDVPAFFSGCLTTTVDTAFPERDRSQQPTLLKTAYVDMPAASISSSGDTFRHSDPKVKQRSFVANLRYARELLERYRTEYSTVVTSRLHCYLPARSLGLNVDFRPKNRADVRFNGLIDLDDSGFDAIRTKMLERLEIVTTAILSGKAEDHVYRLWSELCADDVATAHARHTANADLHSAGADVDDVVKRVRDTAVVTGPEVSGQAVDVVVPVNAAEVKRLPRTIETVLATASKPVRLWLLATGCGQGERARLAEAVPNVRVTWLSRADLPRDAWPIMLADLLADLERVVVLPSTAVLCGDVVELASQDLAGTPLAARPAVDAGAASGFGLLYRAAKRLAPDAATAHDFYRRVHARHVFDFDAFETDVYVADLVRMRKDNLSADMLPYLETFGLTPFEALTLYVGPDRAALPAEWAHIPTHERVVDPRLVYWPGAAKPWQRRYVPLSELWA